MAASLAMPRDARLDRRSIRLPGWDYRRAGWYFVTLSCWGNCHTLARVRHGALVLTRMGEIVAGCWGEIPGHHPQVELDAFVVMPNHIHGIVVITRSPPRDGALETASASGSLAAIIGSYKASCTRKIRRELRAGTQVWQRNFYERVLRDREAVDAVRDYLMANPARWIARRGEV